MVMDKVNVMSDNRELHWAEVNPGLADQYRAEALSTRKILGSKNLRKMYLPQTFKEK